MSIQVLTNYFIEYGAFFIFLIVLLEYLNLPGFPAGVIMPLAGIGLQKGNRISDGDAFVRCGRACRKLGVVSAGAAWRNESDGILFPEVSEAAAGH